MYRLQKLNVEKIVDTKEAADKLVAKGFELIASDEGGKDKKPPGGKSGGDPGGGAK